MAIPIQLKFYRKLELFQELISEDKKARHADGTRRELWHMEKEVLRWTTTGHHHRLSILSNADIQDKVQNLVSRNELDAELNFVKDNLISRGFARGANGGVVITTEGFLMGEVINETMSLLGKCKYRSIIYLAWVFFLGAIFITIKELAEGIAPAIPWLMQLAT